MIDETIFYQLGIFIVLFFLLKAVLFERLGEVIALRDEKTAKLEEKADKKFVEAEELASLYREKIKKANGEGRNIYNRHKQEVVEKEKIRLKEAEEETTIEFEQEIEKFKEKMTDWEKELSKESGAMCLRLVEKLTA